MKTHVSLPSLSLTFFFLKIHEQVFCVSQNLLMSAQTDLGNPPSSIHFTMTCDQSPIYLCCRLQIFPWLPPHSTVKEMLQTYNNGVPSEIVAGKDK